MLAVGSACGTAGAGRFARPSLRLDSPLSGTKAFGIAITRPDAAAALVDLLAGPVMASCASLART